MSLIYTKRISGLDEKQTLFTSEHPDILLHDMKKICHSARNHGKNTITLPTRFSRSVAEYLITSGWQEERRVLEKPMRRPMSDFFQEEEYKA